MEPVVNVAQRANQATGAVLFLALANAPVVQQNKRRGRLPKGIVSLARVRAAREAAEHESRALKAGDFARIEIDNSVNRGKVVRVVAVASTPEGRCGRYLLVESLTGPLARWRFSTGERDNDGVFSSYCEDSLVRVKASWVDAD